MWYATVKHMTNSDTSGIIIKITIRKVSLSREEHKPASLFAHFLTAGHSGFIGDTEVRFIYYKTGPSDTTRHEEF